MNVNNIFKNRGSNTFLVASNTLYQLIGKSLTMAVTIGVTVIITKLYGREAYGSFALMQNWPALFYIILDFGLNAIAAKEITKDEKRISNIFSNILFFRIFLSFLFILMLNLALFAFPYDEALKYGIRLSLLLLITQSLTSTFNIIFQIKLKYEYASIPLICGYAVILVLNAIFAYLHFAVVYLSFSYVIGGVISSFVAYIFVKRLGVTLVKVFDLSFIKTLFLQSLPLGIMFIFSQLNFKQDELLLSVLKLPDFGLSNIDSVGVYGLPYKIFEVALVVPTFFMNVAYPILLRKKLENPVEFKKLLKNILIALFSFGILSGLLGIIFSSLAIKLLGGEGFERSVLVLQILSSGLVLYYLTQPLAWFLVTFNKQIYLPFVYIIAAALNFSLNLVLIPRYSFYGAAVVTHVCELFVLVSLAILVKKALKDEYVF